MEVLPRKNAAMSETDVGDADGTDVFARSYGELMTATGSRGIPAHHPSLPPFPFGGLFRDRAPLAASMLERGRAHSREERTTTLRTERKWLSKYLPSSFRLRLNDRFIHTRIY